MASFEQGAVIAGFTAPPFIARLLVLAVCAPLLFVASPGAAETGKPTVLVDRVAFPPMLGGGKYKKYLTRVLRREAGKADWGAGASSKIEFRFSVDKLSVKQDGDVLKISCAATGRLPRGRTARSKLTFGGSPHRQSKLVKRVLAIVARGVVTRLAEIERIRRGKLRDTRIRTPAD